jgi:hypothetical protein
MPPVNDAVLKTFLGSLLTLLKKQYGLPSRMLACEKTTVAPLCRAVAGTRKGTLLSFSGGCVCS